MPFFLIIAGLILLTAGIRDKQNDLFTLVKGDFTGIGNFVYWVVSILIVGSIGYIDKLKPISDAFLVLILVVLFLSRKGFYAQFVEQIGSTTTSTNTTNPNVVTPTMINVSPSIPQIKIG